MKASELVLAVMQDVQAIAKKDRNTAQGFNFRGIDAVLNHVGPALRKHQGYITTNVLEHEYSVAQTSKGGTLNVCRIRVQFNLYGTEGEPVTSIVLGEAMDSGDKATAKAMSVALRTYLLQLLALPTDEPDPDSFSYEAAPKDWLAEAQQALSVDAVRQIYVAAKADRAPKEVLEQISEFGKVLNATE